MNNNMMKKYIEKLKKESRMTDDELAEKTGIQVLHIANLRNGRVKTPSLNIIEKIASFKKQSPTYVAYDIFFKPDEEDLLLKHSKIFLLFMCKLYLCNCAFSLDKTSTSSFFNNEPISFDGFAYQKIYTTNTMVIDEWDSLISEHKSSINKYISSDDTINLKNNLNYIHDVFTTALSKFNNDTNEIRKYIILIYDPEIFDAISKYKIKGRVSSNIMPIYINNEDMLINELDVSQFIDTKKKNS